MNKKKKIIISVIVFFVLSGILVWQLFFSYSVNNMIIKSREIMLDELNDLSQMYNEEPDDFWYTLLNDEPFPSNNQDDYIFLLISPVFKNTGVIPLTINEAYIEYTGNDEGIARFYSDLTVFPEDIKAFSESFVGCVIVLVYRNGLTDEEVLSQLKDYKLTVYGYNCIFNYLKFEIFLSDYELTIKPLYE